MKTKRTPAQLEATAYHEAGHAIAEWILVVRAPRRLTIEPDGDHLGLCLGSNPLYKVDIDCGDHSPRAQRKTENYARILLAGPAAQRLYNPRSVRSGHGSSDRAHAIDALSFFSNGDTKHLRAYYRLMVIDARNLVASSVNWRAIEILARELLQRRTMSGRVLLREFIISRCFALPNIGTPSGDVAESPNPNT